ncbi:MULTISPECIES: TRAP transporter small permease [Actibacterium]|uniref:TRAP transporter small permease protein n=1 Tax=Actibacterium naphthalenivorans TaxID=1614693 RepID=A0A840CCI7_9RHOB|nr:MULTISPECIES: TRAP transporter small permease [Actibacterium]MBB4022890.1 TRAP-type C4-dicarboxylate transport system permease small subunit [Actibacterium naphthalenivorans]
MRSRSYIASIQRRFRLLAETALVGLVVVTAVDVIGRVVFSSPLGFAYELVGLLLGVSVYAGLIGMNWTRDHIRIDLIEPQLSRMPRFDRIRAGVVWLLEVVFFTILAIFLARQSMIMQRWHETFLFLPLEKWVPLSIYAVFAGLAAVSTVLAVVPTLKASKGDLK